MEVAKIKDIYIVIIEDRHTDVMVHPFTNKEKAISEAKRIAKNIVDHQRIIRNMITEIIMVGFFMLSIHVKVIASEL